MEKTELKHKTIIESCKSGDEKAKYKLYQLYARAMFNLCMRMMNNREEAEDMLQEAFTQAFVKLDSFRYESSFGAWLKRIVVNNCINELNKKRVQLTLCETVYEKEAEDETNEIEGDLKAAEIIRAMEKLPRGGRMVFSLYLLEGYDHREISQIMGISESTSKSQYMRARRRIIDMLKKES